MKMRLLLDTHVFLWVTGESKRLPSSVADVISDTNNDIFVSALTFWEIAIKVRAGRLDIGNVKPGELPSRALEMGFVPIDLRPSEASTSGELAENTHFDPFDRMLIWQAINRDLTLISRDADLKRFKKDGLKLFWK